MQPAEIWYASYGSNMARERLASYLEGGTPAGASLGTPGARDPSPPRDVRPVELAGSVYFAWESPTWGGGVAFYDPRGAGESLGVAYLLTAGQLSDVASQEMHRPPGADLDLRELLRTGSHAFGAGRYETMHVVGSIDGSPVVTFTAPSDSDTASIPYNPPAPAYLATMGRGLLAVYGRGPEAVAAYLVERPGIGPDWTTETVVALLDGQPW